MCEYYILIQQGYTTYTPRLLLIDHKSALCHMPADGGLYSHNPTTTATNEMELSERDTLWDPSRIEVLREDAIERPVYQQDLDAGDQEMDEKDYDFRENTQSWTDYVYSRYHPRTINTLPMLNTKDAETSFDCYSRGTQMWKEQYFGDDFSDQIRHYIEECNNCQGFQALFDCSDAYSGLSMQIFEHIQEDYGKTLFTIPIFSPKQINCGANGTEAMCDSIRVINTALTYTNLIESSSLILPLSTMTQCWRKLALPRRFGGFDYDPNNLYETSAILATYLDSISLRYRCSESIDSCHLANFCNDLTNNGRKLAGAAMAMPFPILANQDLIDCLDQADEPLFTSLSPNTTIGTDYVVQNVSIRGIVENRLKSTKNKNVIDRQRQMAAYHCSSVSEMLQLYFQCNMHCSLSNVIAFDKGMPTKKPFPVGLFGDRYNAIGDRHEFELAEEEKKVNKIASIPVMAAAQCSNDLAHTIETLHREASRIKIKKIHRFQETGFEADDYVDVLERLMEFRENYDDGFDL